jgi:hypothetical protein
MKRLWFGISCYLAFAVILSGTALAQNKHENFVKSYTGTESCTMCHKEAAKGMSESLHYLQLGEPQFLVNWPKGKLAGMMDTF